MEFKALKDKIDYARSLSHSDLPELPVNDFKQLISLRKNSHEPFLIYIDEDDNRIELSYRQFCEKVTAVARYLQSHGLRRGDRVATVSHNHWHTVIQYFACWMTGLVAVPVSLSEDDDRIAYILENGKVELAFIRRDCKDRINRIIEENDALKNIERVICEDTIRNFSHKQGQLTLEAENFGSSEALIVYTSGTTGAPKGVILTQRNLLEDARAIADWHGVDEQTRMMCVLPIHHVNGTVVTMITPFFAGGSTVLNQKFRVSRFFPIIREEKVHVVSAVPTLLQFLINYYSDKEKPKTEPLRHIICGAGPLTVKIQEDFEEQIGAPVIHGYGLSETTCYSCFIPLDISKEEHNKWRSDYGYPSIGVPLPVNEMQIHDDKGNMLDENKRGEIVVRGVNVMKEYYNNKEANEKTFKHGLFRSGDEGFFINDEEGRPYFFITGRLKELIIRGAVNLAPLEIDEVINKAPGVKAGIAVGFENDWYGEEVGAYIQLKEGVEKDKQVILDFCRKILPFNKTPKALVFGEELPVTSTGKYQRNKVAHLFEAWKEKQFKEA